MEDPLIGKTLGQYRIVAPIGQGGMGAVYRAQDTRLGREVAVKVLPPDLARDQEFVERFEREAHTAASLDHPNIVAIYNIGEQDGLHYIAMRLLRGQPLNRLLAQTGALPLPRALRLLEQVASALDYAHHHGIIHRDIKPANIMVGDDEYVTLMDFGIARALVGSKITRTGVMIGTPEYMAPEQFTGETVDARADVYALSVVLYEMLTGRVPFSGDTPVAISHGHVYQSPAPPSHLNPQIPPAVEQVVLRGLAKRPDARYPGVGALSADLRAALEGRAAPTPVVLPLKVQLHNGREFPLTPGVLRLGRASDNEIALTDERVSRYHAEIRSDALSHVLVDLGSANGTYLDGQRAPAHRPQTLRAGMQIALGAQTTLLVQAGPPAPAPAGGRTVSLSSDATPPPDTRASTQPATLKPPMRERKKSPGFVWPILMLLLFGCLAAGAVVYWQRDQAATTPSPATASDAQPAAVATWTPQPTTAEPPPESTATPVPTAPPESTATPVPTTPPIPTETPKPMVTLKPATPLKPLATLKPTALIVVTPVKKPPQLVYACGNIGNSDICLVDLDTDRAQTLIQHTADDAEPDSSGDGRIAFQSNRNGDYDIWVRDTQGRSLTNLTQTAGQDERMPDWSPDGQQVAYEVGDGNNNSEVWGVNVQSGKRQSLGITGRAPAWSPQGDKLVVMRKERNGYWQIHVVDVGTKRDTLLAHSNEHCRFPAWSPDGQWIVYNTYTFGSSPTGQSYEVWRMASDGSGQPEQLTSNGENGRPAWSPDGNYIAYNHGDYLYTFRIDSRTRTRQLKATFNGWAPDWVYGYTE